MNKIDAIVVHCSATKAGQDIGKKEITQMHLQRGFSTIGYNFIIRLDGTVEVGRSLTIDGAHCNSKGFSGVDAHGKAADTRTPEQKKALSKLIKELCSKYEIVEVLGHRDTSPDLDGDGIVEPEEWTKMCPCFDAKEEYSDLLAA